MIPVRHLRWTQGKNVFTFLFDLLWDKVLEKIRGEEVFSIGISIRVDCEKILFKPVLPAATSLRVHYCSESSETCQVRLSAKI